MSVLLETDALVAEDETRVRVWVENPATTALSPATVLVTLPASLETRPYGLTGCGAPSDSISVGPVPPASVTSLDLCLRSKKVVVEGTFTVGFTLLYGRGTGPKPTSYILVEKSVSIGLFGNDAVAGISLRLASLVVPGLLFFLLLQLGKLGVVSALDGLRVSALSVLFSLLLTVVASELVPPAQVRGISVSRFVGLCISAVALGLVVLAPKWLLQVMGARRDAARVVPNDDEITALRKALKQHPTARDPVTVTLVAGGELIGSAVATTADGGTALLGWFEVTVPEGQRKAMEALQRSGNYAKLLNQVTAAGLGLTPLNAIRERAGGTLSDVTGALTIKRFAPNEVRSAVAGPVSGIGTDGPIRVS